LCFNAPAAGRNRCTKTRATRYGSTTTFPASAGTVASVTRVAAADRQSDRICRRSHGRCFRRKNKRHTHFGNRSSCVAVVPYRIRSGDADCTSHRRAIAFLGLLDPRVLAAAGPRSVLCGPDCCNHCCRPEVGRRRTQSEEALVRGTLPLTGHGSVSALRATFVPRTLELKEPLTCVIYPQAFRSRSG